MNVFFSAFFLSIALIALTKSVFQRLKWLDRPHLYGYERSPVPYGVGIILFLCFAFMAPFCLEVSGKVIALLIAGGLLTLTCFIDDRKGLPALPRLLIQIFCAAIVVLAGVGVPAISNPFGDPIVLDSIVWNLEFGIWSLQLEPLADLVALIWIVFVVNAINWLDGVPGVVSGTSTIACGVLYLLATMNDLHVIDQTNLSMMALILGGSSLAFLVFDFPRPKVLMGDSGTMFLGLMIAVMAIFSGGKLATAFIVLGIPILDAVWTIVRRLLKRQSPWRGDFQHFHHELLRAGLSERQVNIFFYSISLGFGYAALSLQSMGKMLAIILLFALMVMVRLWLMKRA